MTKEKAKEILQNYLDMHPLPIVDAVLYKNKHYPFDNWTFKGLITIAYDLRIPQVKLE